jgi:hypothetical protein
MANYLSQIRARPRLSTSSLPGAYPIGHPADDDDWETVTEEEESVAEGPSYQGYPVSNAVYPAYQGVGHPYQYAYTAY